MLPQSFSPPRGQENKQLNQNNEESNEKVDGKGEATLLLDLNGKTGASSSSNQPAEENATQYESITDDGLLTIGLGNGTIKARGTGFKPYKRCSVEAKEDPAASLGSKNEEKGPKRIRLEEEASS